MCGVVCCSEPLTCDILSRSSSYSKLVCFLVDAACHCLLQLAGQTVGTQLCLVMPPVISSSLLT